MNEATPEALFSRYRRDGDPTSLARLFDLTAPEVYRVARYLSRNDDEAEDLLQATFLVVIERVASFREGAPVMPWLLGILANKARRLGERRQLERRRLETLPSEQHRSELERHAAVDVDPVAAARAEELRSCLDQKLERLSPTLRPVLVLHLRHGMEAAEIAQVLERPRGTVRSQICRGMEALRQSLPPGLSGFGIAAAIAPQALAQVRRTVLARAWDPALSGVAGSTTPFAPAITIAIASLMKTKTALLGAALAMTATALVFWQASAAAPDESSSPLAYPAALRAGVPDVAAGRPSDISHTERSPVREPRREDPTRLLSLVEKLLYANEEECRLAYTLLCGRIANDENDDPGVVAREVLCELLKDVRGRGALENPQIAGVLLVTKTTDGNAAAGQLARQYVGFRAPTVEHSRLQDILRGWPVSVRTMSLVTQSESARDLYANLLQLMRADPEEGKSACLIAALEGLQDGRVSDRLRALVEAAVDGLPPEEALQTLLLAGDMSHELRYDGESPNQAASLAITLRFASGTSTRHAFAERAPPERLRSLYDLAAARALNPPITEGEGTVLAIFLGGSERGSGLAASGLTALFLSDATDVVRRSAVVSLGSVAKPSAVLAVASRQIGAPGNMEDAYRHIHVLSALQNAVKHTPEEVPVVRQVYREYLSLKSSKVEVVELQRTLMEWLSPGDVAELSDILEDIAVGKSRLSLAQKARAILDRRAARKK